MTKMPIRKPRCQDCPHYGVQSGPYAQKVKGAYLQVGSRYCSGGKRIKVFKPRDPKTQIPTWCPRRKSPAELRIYCYKDSNTWYLHHLMESRGIQSSPSGFEYAVRYEGTVESTAREFYEQLQQKLVSDILGFHVGTNEIIEIDDGLVPYYFHISDYGANVLTYFNRDTARKNKLEHSSTDDSPISDKD